MTCSNIKHLFLGAPGLFSFEGTANVRFPTILMISWFNVRVARIGMVFMLPCMISGCYMPDKFVRLL